MRRTAVAARAACMAKWARAEMSERAIVQSLSQTSALSDATLRRESERESHRDADGEKRRKREG